MALASKNIEKPLDKLRKSLKKMPNRPTPDEVHDLRTNSRRVEATLHALMLDRKRRGRRVLKAVTPLRKRAGSVRDMDVLTGFASTLSEDGNNQCLVQLLEHLGETRFQDARLLRRSVKKRKQIAGRRLKRCARFIVKNLNGSKKRQREWLTDSAAVALQLSGELAQWPRLTRENLHPFRLKVKELRNVLRLSADSGELVKVLGDVKDAVGEWHDWTELSAIAEKVLKNCDDCDVVNQIDSIATKKLDAAMKLASQVREEYFSDSRGGNRNRRARGKGVKQPVLESVARLTA